MWWAAALLGWAIFAIWFVFLVPTAVLDYLRTVARCTRGIPEPKAWPRVTVIVPARDEAAAVNSCLSSILASNYPDIEVIAVNDRSTDDTGEIMDRVAAGDERLRVIHLQTLPEGWIGKNYAMHTAAASASGEFLLFTDGDVSFDAGTIRRTTSYMLHRRLDHLVVAPRMIAGGYLERVLLTFFCMVYLVGIQPWLVRSRWRRYFAGLGAFNCVRRDAYESTGGFKTLCLEVIEDAMLGRLIKFSGYRSDFLRSSGAVVVRWQPSAWGLIRGIEKNAFASVDYSLWTVVLLTFVILCLLALPYATLFLYADARVFGYAAALVLLHGSFGFIGYFVAGDWLVFPLLPVGAAGMTFAMWRSTWITLRLGGVRWRESFYPLAALRNGRFRSRRTKTSRQQDHAEQASPVRSEP